MTSIILDLKLFSALFSQVTFYSTPPEVLCVDSRTGTSSSPHYSAQRNTRFPCCATTSFYKNRFSSMVTFGPPFLRFR
ncbi:hypothetical protein BDN72DRAFT_521749 [Pluteus cervinus]|uniref:Uncharacterized protein n=1 Tax=Pluteus cervinus TaxID=181527 RepID=A0ACD3AYH0_9AGAR|nr:hypothetical protein BDN72DRAFT_521749 [Pluteus cervinus]